MASGVAQQGDRLRPSFCVCALLRDDQGDPCAQQVAYSETICGTFDIHDWLGMQSLSDHRCTFIYSLLKKPVTQSLLLRALPWPVDSQAVLQGQELLRLLGGVVHASWR